jgi:hypothetical protein
MQIQISVETEITELHNEIAGHLQQSLDKAIRIGELLAEQKRNLEHGEFTHWIAEHLPFTDRTARNYMKLHENREKLKTETVSDLTSAYKLLAAPKESVKTTHSHEAESVIKSLREKYDIDAITADLRYINYIGIISNATNIKGLQHVVDKMQSYQENLVRFRIEIERHTGMLLREIEIANQCGTA